jgi:hypothetical protein
MRKVATFLGATLAMAWLTSTVAQAQAPDAFKDLDPSHWAYQATENLRKKNIVWGYPDGYFRGKRTLTRYEFAVALDRALQTIPAPGTGPQGPAGPAGERGAQGERGERGEIGPPGMTPEEVAQFRRLMNEFKDELAGLGNSVAAVNRKVDALAARVAAIEDILKKMPKLWGGAWFGIRSDRANGGYVDYDGRVFGIGGPGGSGLVNTPVVLHQYMLGVDANIAGGATLSAALTSNNYKNYLGGNLAVVGPLVTTSAADTYVHHLEINTPFSGLGRGSKLTLGRFGHKISRFVLWKPDVDRYFMNPFEDDGNYYMDGVRLTTNFGSVGIEAFGAQTKANTGTNGGFVNSPLAGASITGGLGNALFIPGGGGLIKPFGQPFQGQMIVDQLAGISGQIGFNVLQGGHIRLSAVDTSSELPGTVGVGFTNVLNLGADVDVKLADRFTFTGNWGKTITGRGRFDSVNTHANNAFDARVGWNSGSLNVTAGYRYIDPLFYAPGYWGRIGNWINPTNVAGPTFRAGLDLSPSFGVNLGGDFYSAARNRSSFGGLNRNDDINRVLVGLRWDVAKNFRTTIDWEGVFWKLSGAHAGVAPGASGTVHPTEHYVTVGTGYNLTSNTTLKLNYVVGDFNGHGFLSSPAGTRYNFKTFTAQANVKF